MLWQLGKKDDYNDDKIILQVTYADMFTLYWIAFYVGMKSYTVLYELLSDINVCFTITLVSTLGWLVEIWQPSQKGATGELEVEFKFQRCTCKLSFLFLPRRQSALQSLLAGYVNTA